MLPGKKLIQRWSLVGPTREKVALLDIDFVPSSFAMGHSSNGPILIGGSDRHYDTYQLLDPTTLSAIDIKFDPKTGPGRFEVSSKSRVRASADGSVFACWRTSVSPSGLMSLSINGNHATPRYEHEAVGYIAPSADGSRLFTVKGTYSPQLKLIDHKQKNAASSFTIPAVTGEYYLRLDRFDTHQSRKSEKKRPDVAIFISGHDQPIANIPSVSIRSRNGDDSFVRVEPGPDERVLFFPDHDVLATLPESNDSIVFRDISLDEKLEESGIDYLFVTSSPPRRASVGQEYEYQIIAKSKHGKLVFKTLSGPDGLKVDAKGKVTWRPGVKESGSHDILLSVTDAMSTEVYHTFKLVVLAKGAGKA